MIVEVRVLFRPPLQLGNRRSDSSQNRADLPIVAAGRAVGLWRLWTSDAIPHAEPRAQMVELMITRDALSRDMEGRIYKLLAVGH